MSTDAKPDELSKFWAVRFETKDGAYHPLWYKSDTDALISRAEVQSMSAQYLAKHHDWLKQIDEIYIPNR